MTERELLRSQWRDVADELGIDFVAPALLELPNGRAYEFAALLPQFGGPRGMLIDSAQDKEVFSAAIEAGYGVSSMGAEHHYLPVSAEHYLDTLIDWGWVGIGAPPIWLEKAPNSSFNPDAPGRAG